MREIIISVAIYFKGFSQLSASAYTEYATKAYQKRSMYELIEIENMNKRDANKDNKE